MTVWGFLAVLVICASVVTIVVFYIRSGGEFEFEIGSPLADYHEAKSGAQHEAEMAEPEPSKGTDLPGEKVQKEMARSEWLAEHEGDDPAQ